MSLFLGGVFLPITDLQTKAIITIICPFSKVIIKSMAYILTSAHFHKNTFFFFFTHLEFQLLVTNLNNHEMQNI